MQCVCARAAECERKRSVYHVVNIIDHEASVALAADGRVEIFGDEKQVQGRLSCRIGPRSFPFELCEERLLTPGLVKSVLGQ